MNKPINYSYRISDNLPQLIVMVRGDIEEGWQPQGGITVFQGKLAEVTAAKGVKGKSTTLFLQALVMYRKAVPAPETPTERAEEPIMIAVGGNYVTRDGSRAIIVTEDSDPDFPFLGVVIRMEASGVTFHRSYWNREGFSEQEGEPSAWDLMREIRPGISDE